MTEILKFKNGEWRPDYADRPDDGTNIHDFVVRHEPLLRIEGRLTLTVYSDGTYSGGVEGFYLCVGNELRGLTPMYVEDLPTLLDLLGRWQGAFELAKIAEPHEKWARVDWRKSQREVPADEHARS